MNSLLIPHLSCVCATVASKAACSSRSDLLRQISIEEQNGAPFRLRLKSLPHMSTKVTASIWSCYLTRLHMTTGGDSTTCVYILAFKGLYTKYFYLYRVSVTWQPHAKRKKKQHSDTSRYFIFLWKRPVFFLHIHIYPYHSETPAITVDMQGPLHMIIIYCVLESLKIQRTPLLINLHEITS